MSVRREILQIARLAPTLLSESIDNVVSFVRSRQTADGGFANRAGESDLYYTVFGLQALVALRVDLPSSTLIPYLARFGDGEGLDLVHLASLAGCWAMIAQAVSTESGNPVPLRCPARHPAGRSSTGSKAIAHPMAATTRRAAPNTGPPMHAFLALGAYEDLDAAPPEPERLAHSVDALRSGDGAFANDRGLPVGSTPATAAAVAIYRHLDAGLPAHLTEWLLAQRREGGFLASPQTPIPDLLSTAVALHALTSLRAPLDGIRESCLDFIDTLWTSQGAFLGSWVDDVPDCEYTLLRPARPGPPRGVTRRSSVMDAARRAVCGASRGRANGRRPLGRRVVEQRAVDRHGARRARSLRSRRRGAVRARRRPRERRDRVAAFTPERGRRLGRHRPQLQQHQHDGARLGGPGVRGAAGGGCECGEPARKRGWRRVPAASTRRPSREQSWRGTARTAPSRSRS